jgi:hypothetical protein
MPSTFHPSVQPAKSAVAFSRLLTAIATTSFICSALAGHAQNIDLSTVPKRDSVQLTIYNSEDLTLVRETRVITFKKGSNPLQFSWANTLIDPSSVELKFLTSADKLEVLDTTFPHDKPQMLYWNVESEFDGEATIQITYFTSGITWSADYVAVASADESKLDIEGFVRITNNSGEEYENAQVRLVVGTINLVEKIAQLAQIPMSEVAQLEEQVQLEFRREAAVRSLGKMDAYGMAGGVTAATPTDAAQPKEIIKEGLSEYFIYTVEGTETIPNGWSKRMRSFDADEVPMKIQYRYRPQEYGEQLVRMYLLTNDEDSKLGTTPLPDGAVRLFRDNGRDGLSYLAQQSIKYIPIGDKIELNLGVDSEVVFDLVKLRSRRDEIWMQVHGVNVFHQVGGNDLKLETNASVVGWDDHSTFVQRVRNYTDKPIDVEIRRSYDGHVFFRSKLEPKLHDYRTVQFSARVDAGEKENLFFEVIHRQGHNAKQNNVTLEAVDVAGKLSETRKE